MTENPYLTRMLTKLVVGDCWEWTGARQDGYGRVYVGGRKVRQAHRFLWEQLVGPIPEGLQLDHLCRNPPCVNPDHLEPVTSGENVRRGSSAPATRARWNKPNCPQGHERSEANTRYHPSGRRICRVCERDKRRAVRRAKREAEQ